MSTTETTFLPQKKGPFLVTARRKIYKNPWIEVTEDSIIRPDGDAGIFGTIDLKPGVTILPVYPDGRVLLAHEFKYAHEGNMIEVMGGSIEPGESPEAAASRELAEEGGIGAGQLISMGLTHPLPTLIRTNDYLIIATDLHDLPNKPPADDVVEPFKIPLKTAVEYVLNGNITHTISSLLILKAALKFPEYLK